MTNIQSSVLPDRDAVAVTVALMAMFAWCGSATAAFYINCAGCHTTPQNGMAIINYQTTTNLGNGLLKVFQVNPGQTAVIQLDRDQRSRRLVRAEHQQPRRRWRGQ